MWDKFLDGLAGFLFYGSWASPIATFTIVWNKINKSKGVKIILGIILSIVVALLMIVLGIAIGYRHGYTH